MNKNDTDFYAVRVKTSDEKELFYKRGERLDRWKPFCVCSLFNKGRANAVFKCVLKYKGVQEHWSDPHILWDSVELLKVSVSLSPVPS